VRLCILYRSRNGSENDSGQFQLEVTRQDCMAVEARACGGRQVEELVVSATGCLRLEVVGKDHMGVVFETEAELESEGR
jgi:hypothetical protein